MQVTPVVLHTLVQMWGEQAQELGLRHVVNGEQACAWVTRVILQRRSCAGEEFDVVAGACRRREVAGVNCGCRSFGLRVRVRRAVGVGAMAGVGFFGGRNKEVQVVLVADSSAEDMCRPSGSSMWVREGLNTTEHFCCRRACTESRDDSAGA